MKMYLVPNSVTSTIAPYIYSNLAATNPTTILLNAPAPSVVYERQIGAPIFSNHVPLFEIDSQKKKNNEEYIDEKEIDDFIKRKVNEQLQKEYLQKEKKRENFGSKNCKCFCNKNSKNDTVLTLNEKIEQIRKELNLTNEIVEQKPINIFHEYEIIYEHKEKRHLNNPKIHFKINCENSMIKKSNNSEREKLYKKKMDETKKNKPINIDDIINIGCKCKTSDKTTLDEKLKLIREDPNLLNENLTNELNKMLINNQTKHDLAKKRHQKIENSNNSNTHYQIKSKPVKNTENNEKFEKNNKSKKNYFVSKFKTDIKNKMSEQKTYWVPTGSNDYSQTNSKRMELVDDQINYNITFYDDQKSRVNKLPTSSYEIYKPAQTIYETSVQSKSYFTDRPLLLIDPTKYNHSPNYIIDHSTNYKTNYGTSL